MTKRSYKQHCMLAKALDVVGERWTLLIARELLMGPKRYKDLVAALPGLGTNLLAARLKHLQSEGLVEQVTVGGGATGYALTELGQTLEEPVMALALWGRRYMADRDPGHTHKLAWMFLALRRFYSSDAIADAEATIAFAVDGEELWIRASRGELTTGEGQLPSVDAVCTGTAQGVRALIFGPGPIDADTLASLGMGFRGDLDALNACLSAFG